jgi:galactan 5-O-arabinofuranosyltransferase
MVPVSAQLDREAELAEPVPARTGARRAVSRVMSWAAEVLAATLAALLFPLWSSSIRVDPLVRIGQVSGLAGLQLRFAAIGVCLLVAVLVGLRTRWRTLTVRLACAVVAGLATGLIGGGLVVALHGTSLPLFGEFGDSWVLAVWADELRAGLPVPAHYPPLFVHALAWWADATGSSTLEALKPLDIVTTSLFGPAAYLAWRTLLPPVWALGVGLFAALPVIEPYKPYTTVVLVVLVPVLIQFLRFLRACATRSYVWVGAAGAGFGVIFAGLFLFYSGWYVWSAPGVLAAVLLHFPWRGSWLRGVVLLSTSAAVFYLLSERHLHGLLRGSGTVKDRYFYFDVYVDPAYVAMARGPFPGNPGPWPPPGELGGVGLFTLLLALGLAVAVALGMRDSVVSTAGCLFAGAWLLRFYYAAQMYRTETVQLYPRTTPEIQYCLLVLTGFACYLLVRQVDALSWFTRLGRQDRPTQAVGGAGSAAVGALCALLLLVGSIGSAISDRYLPREDNSPGRLAWTSHYTWHDGQCSQYVARDRCTLAHNKAPFSPRVAT